MAARAAAARLNARRQAKRLSSRGSETRSSVSMPAITPVGSPLSFLFILLLLSIPSFNLRPASAQPVPSSSSSPPAATAVADCGFTMDDYAEGVTDAVPLSPMCAVVKVTSPLLAYPHDFFQQHALCPDAASLSFSPTGAPAATSLDFATPADASGGGGKATAYTVSGRSAEFRGMRSFTLAAQRISTVAAGKLTIATFFSFVVNTSDPTPPLFFAEQQPNAILAWNYDADQKTGYIKAVNVALFAPVAGVTAADAETYVRGATMKGSCVEAYGPSNYSSSGATTVQFLGVEEFATGRLQLYAQLQKGNCSVHSAELLNEKPMITGCGIPPPPSPAESRKLFLQCGGQLALPFILDGLKNLLKDSANQTVPNLNQTAPTGGVAAANTTSKLRLRGSTLLNAIANGIGDVSGSFEYDGLNTWGLNFSAALGDLPGDVNLTAFQFLVRILDKCAPFLDVKINKGPIPNPMLTASFSYNSKSQLVDIRFTTRYALWLLSAAVADLGQILNFKINDPPPAGPDSPTLSARLVADRVYGLRLLSIGLDGSWTVGSLARRIGFSWPFADDVISISNPNVILVAPPSFEMEDGVVLPTSFRINVLLSIKGIGLQNAVAGLVVQAKTAVVFSVYGDSTPIPSFPAFVAKGFSFTVANDNSITATFTAKLFEINLLTTFTYKEGVVTASLVATNVQVVNIVKGIFSDITIPDVILNLIKPLKFSNVTVTLKYDPDSVKKLSFTFSAVPDVKDTPIGDALEAIGLDSKDLALAFKPGKSGVNELSFGVSKTIQVNLPSPFTGPGQCSFSLQVKGSNVMVYGSFQAAIDFAAAETPLNFSIGAGVLIGSTGALLQIDAALLSPFSIKGFPFLVFNSLSLSATIQIASPPVLRALTFTGSQKILGAEATQLFAYDTTVAPPVFAIFVSISNFDLQTALNQIGINVNLGMFNFLIRYASVSYSGTDVTVNGITVPQGLGVKGSIVLFGLLDTTLSLFISPVKTEFYVSVNATVLNEVLVKYVLKPITDVLNAAGDACKAGANAVGRAKDAANDALELAKKKLEEARVEVNNKLRSLLYYRDQINDALERARVKAQQALNVFNDAKAAADRAVAVGMQKLDEADNRFQTAMNRVNSAFQSAQNRLNNAQRDYDNWHAEATRKLNKANEDVNVIQDKINCAKRFACNCFWFFGTRCLSCCPGYFLILPGLYAALGIAKAVLWAAQKILDTLVTATVYVTLLAARAAVGLAQGAVNAVARGAEWLALQSARLALLGFQAAARAVLTGTEAIARAAADAALRLAQATVNGVMTSTYYVSSAAANATFLAAEAGVTSAQFATNAALTVVQEALEGIGSALKFLADPSWFQINAFSLGFSISPQHFIVNGSIDVKLGGMRLNPSFSVDISNPFKLILDLVKGLAIKALKAIFPGLAKALT